MWRMSLWTLTSQSLKNPAHVRRVVVVLLTGQKLEALVDPSTTAQQMFESIITHIELPEFFFFGLTHINGDLSIYYWLIYNELIIVFPIRKKNLKSCKWSLEYDQSLNLYMWTWRLNGAFFSSKFVRYLLVLLSVALTFISKYWNWLLNKTPLSKDNSTIFT